MSSTLQNVVFFSWWNGLSRENTSLGIKRNLMARGSKDKQPEAVDNLGSVEKLMIVTFTSLSMFIRKFLYQSSICNSCDKDRSWRWWWFMHGDLCLPAEIYTAETTTATRWTSGRIHQFTSLPCERNDEQRWTFENPTDGWRIQILSEGSRTARRYG